jgi:flavorubredoxin
LSRPTAPVKIADGIYWAGALNPNMKRFDVIMETDFGSSYNSYIVQGAEKIALIDCVRDGFLEESLALMRQVIDPAKIDCIIIQHSEPDHSGALKQLLNIAKNARVFCSRAASMNLPFITHADLPMTVVKDGDEIDLGGRKLRIIAAPFLHWPDTLFTYDEASGSLFTCDVFGSHFAPFHVLESLTDKVFKGQRRYYYDCIMSPFASNVKKALETLKALNLRINAILPSHGPVLDKDPQEAISHYDRWSRAYDSPGGQKRVFIPYVSSYGYTAQLANIISDELTAQGCETDVVDIAELPSEEVTHRIHAADALALGSPTINQDALPPVWLALSHVSVPLVRGRKAIVFGSYGWSGEGVPFAEQRLTNLGFKVVGTLRVRFRPDEKALADARALAQSLAEALK